MSSAFQQTVTHFFTGFSIRTTVTTLNTTIKRNLPFLGAFHHQFLIRSHKLELGRVLAHALEPLPHRGHDPSGDEALPASTSFSWLPAFALTPVFTGIRLGASSTEARWGKERKAGDLRTPPHASRRRDVQSLQRWCMVAKIYPQIWKDMLDNPLYIPAGLVLLHVGERERVRVRVFQDIPGYSRYTGALSCRFFSPHPAKLWTCLHGGAVIPWG